LNALANGAVAVVSEDSRPPDVLAPWVTVPDARFALGHLAAYFRGFPSRRLGLIGVTGTDGKTTTAHLIASILDAAGLPVGLTSTVYFRLGSEIRANRTGHSTPPPAILQDLLASMVEQGLRWAVLEVTSHAIDQMRIAGCEFDIGVFTNLTPEHLNCHGDFDHYRQTKAQLFSSLGRETKPNIPTFGVFNLDDPSSREMRAGCSVEHVTYGIDGDVAYRVTEFQTGLTGTTISLSTPNGPLQLWTPLAGRFNVYNVSAACAVALRIGISADVVRQAVKEFTGVPGRLQEVDEGQPFKLFVDFAHTPNALSVTLKELRSATRGRLIIVFGHAGGRDLETRRGLGRVAATMSDVAIITTDDPCDEDPREIIDQIEDGIRSASRSRDNVVLRIVDRGNAIERAVQMARAGDTVLIAGRGHEDYMIVRGRKIPFNDLDVARRSVAFAYPTKSRSPRVSAA
ncbi:MAG TPA: UDP-N-acetylmuramoyl-L-alanyl-D-glutamate--2,6-diaminopimelate ligase, partial [Chloroflexota bacterium]|nr:UDP-N-acetylmuramoyl-L-alanyl-D-glutamate--2,6-diaminopimelate ligase [Chloroflexota bacterium]